MSALLTMTSYKQLWPVHGKLSYVMPRRRVARQSESSSYLFVLFLTNPSAALERLNKAANGTGIKEEHEDGDRGSKREPKNYFRQLHRSNPSQGMSRWVPGDVALDELKAGEVQVKDEDMDVDMLDKLESAIKQTEAEEKSLQRVMALVLGHHRNNIFPAASFDSTAQP